MTESTRPTEGLTWNLEGELYDLIKEEVLAFWASIQEKYANGEISLMQIFELVSEMVEAFVRIAEKLNVPNELKRELLLEVIDETYEQVIKPLDIPYVPNVFEPFVDAWIGRLVHASAEQALEYLLPDSNAPKPNAGEELDHAASKAVSDAEED